MERTYCNLTFGIGAAYFYINGSEAFLIAVDFLSLSWDECAVRSILYSTGWVNFLLNYGECELFVFGFARAFHANIETIVHIE